MSELAEAEAQVASWLQPLPDDAAPCGADLEYDNEFLSLTQAAAGKPETQFGPAEPPDWRAVVSTATSLFDRTRDLRVAVDWTRGNLRLIGYAALPLGLKLIHGLLTEHWDHVHPLPDPDDGDPYGRVNALLLLREHAGLLGDLREATLTEDRSIGLLRARDVESVLAHPGTAALPTELTKEQAAQMLAAAVAKDPGLRAVCNEAVAQLKALMSAANDKLGGDAPDLRPLYNIVNGVAGMLPPEASDEPEAEGSEGGEGEGGGEGGSGGGRGHGLSGSVRTREEAMRAIDLVIEFLERTEPANPAPLFLRRARMLVGHNFLQLMKVLAPDALSEVARIVGVDPETVVDPNAPPPSNDY